MKEKYTITVELYQKTVADLLPYYERFKELCKEAGVPHMSELTFEEYLTDMLASGCKYHMLSNAKGMEMSLEQLIANQKGPDKNG